MGSLNQDGSRKTTVNKMGRNNGGRQVFSQNRIRLSSVKNPSAIESSLNLADEQTQHLTDSTINLGARLKLINEDGISSTITEGSVVDLTSPNPPFSFPEASTLQKMIILQRLTTQAVGAASSTDVSWTTETRDDFGISAVGDGANTKVCTFTEETAGIWTGTAAARFSVTNYASLGIFLYDSSNTLKWAIDQDGTSSDIEVSGQLVVAAGDYIKIIAFSTPGCNIGGPLPYTHCTFKWEGA